MRVLVGAAGGSLDLASGRLLQLLHSQLGGRQVLLHAGAQRNGFLAAGLIWGLLAADPVGFQVKVFFLLCVIVAGLYGAATVSRRILLVQALPAVLALVAVGLAGQTAT